MARPVVLLTFANDRYGPTTGYLRDLIGEQRAVESALQHAPVEVVVRANVTLDELFDLFTRYGRRLVVWHHGGHAGPDAVFLEDDRGQARPARVEGLALRAAGLRRLALVVLNGCSTAGQVAVLEARCRAAIVATDQAILDDVARTFAARLHRELAAGHTIEQAFEAAAARVLADAPAGAGPSRMLRPSGAAAGVRPWRLHVPARAPMAGRWRIPDATPDRRPLWALAGAGALLAIGLGWALVPDIPAPQGPVCPSRAEMCDGMDDDCDGRIDEAGSGSMCGPTWLTGIWGKAECTNGLCGMTACPSEWHDIDGLHVNRCEYACTPTGEEVCNESDDDCDGAVDEGLGACDVGCDGRDDDADGRSDEGCAVVRCGPKRAGQAPVPPCNGCPDGVDVPAGWVCIPPGELAFGPPDGIEIIADGTEAEPLEETIVEAKGNGGKSTFRTLPKMRRWVRPQAVHIDAPYLIMATELSQRAWADVAGPAGGGVSPSYRRCARDAGGRCPVERVSVNDAIWWANAASDAAGLTRCYDQDLVSACQGRPGAGCADREVGCGYARVLNCAPGVARVRPGCTGLRLPTHAEWDYAARAGRDVARVDGGGVDALSRSAWFADNSDGVTRPVGQLAPNSWGLYDVLGNVWELVPSGQLRGCSFACPASSSQFSILGRDNRRYRSRSVGLRFVRAVPLPGDGL